MRGGQEPAQIEPEQAEHHRGIGARLAEIFAHRAPGLPPDRYTTVAAVCVATARAVFPLIVQATPAEAAVLTTELKTIVAGYLTQALPPSPV
ncbi:hypothetical protein [Sinosporangium siamense]|nr:hypothetical protein [Sinosporangium siamense]